MKTYTTLALTTPRGDVTLIPAATPADLDRLAIDPGLSSIVHNPELLRRVLRALAADPRARLVLAVHDGTLIGRAALAPSFGRWQALPNAREYALELARGWRGLGLAGALTRATLDTPIIERELLLAFLMPSAWDAEYEGLSEAVYGARLAGMLQRHRFQPTGTDEPEVRLRQNAALLVRRGTRVSATTLAAFEETRYERRGSGVLVPRAA
jgi:acetoin utilization protein AcuA